MEITTSASTGKNTRAVKTVQVIARYALKTDGVLNGTILYLVRNGGDKEYLVTLVEDGHATSCIQCENDELCEAGQYSHKCYHKKQCEQIESARSAHVQEHGVLAGFVFTVVRAEEVVHVALEQDGDMSVAEHLLEEELAAYEKELRYEGIADLRMRVAHAGLSVASRSKEPLIRALVAHRRATIVHPVIVPNVSPEVPTSDVDMPTDCPQNALCLFCKEQPAVQDGYCSPLCADDAQAAIEEADARMEEVTSGLVPVVDAMLDEEAMQPKEYTRAQVIMRILADCDSDHASKPNGIGFNGTDTEFGHDLATRHTLTEKQLKAAAKMLQKYNRTQLGGIVPPMAVVEKVLSPMDQRGNLNKSNQGFNVLLHR